MNSDREKLNLNLKEQKNYTFDLAWQLITAKTEVQ